MWQKFLKGFKYVFLEDNPTQGLLCHTPHGIINVFLAVEVHWSIGLLFGIGFIAFEVMHEWRTRDDSWNDLAGWLLGLVIGGLIYRVI